MDTSRDSCPPIIGGRSEASTRLQIPILTICETLLLMAMCSWIFAGTFTVFGPKTYVRSAGRPARIKNSFKVLNPTVSYSLRVLNSRTGSKEGRDEGKDKHKDQDGTGKRGPDTAPGEDRHGDEERGGDRDGHRDDDNGEVSRAVIILNGLRVVDPDDFKNKVEVLDRGIKLLRSNEIEVEVLGKRGGTITVEIVGVDNDLPSIQATVTPKPNAAGWNNTSVTVTFTCNDLTSGILSCPPPQTITKEGADQVISGTATDNAGNTASTSVTLNIDKTPPTVSIKSPVDGSVLANPVVTVAGQALDSLSGISSVTCNGTPANLQGGSFSCPLTLNPGVNTLTVRASDLAGNTAIQSENVTLEPGKIAQISPNVGQQGQQNLSVALTGQLTHWVQGMTTASFGAGITVTSLTVNSATSATAVVHIDPASPTGPRMVTVITGGEVLTLANGFAVTSGTAILLAVNPNSGQQGQSLSVALSGQFTHWFQAMSAANFGAGITVASLTVNSPTNATAVVNIDPASPTGQRTVTVTTGSEVATLTNGFAVTAATPIMLTVNPNSGQQGQLNLPVGLTGQASHFLQGITQVSFGAGITVLSLTVNSPTSATAVLNIDPAAAAGPRTVIVATQGEIGSLSNGFIVSAGTPMLQSVNPNNGQQGQQNLTIVLMGQFTHWAPGATTANFGAGISVASLMVNSATSATATLNIDASATVGSRPVVLTTGSEVETLNGGFTVTGSAPILLSVSPNSGQEGQQNLPVTIVGQFMHFLQGTSQVSFGAGIVVTSLTVNSPTSAAAILSVDYSAAPGARTVTFTTGAEVASLTNGFTVIAATPTLLPVNPNSGLQGQQNLSVAISGQFTHFVQGTTTAGFGQGITVASVTVNSPSNATAILNIDATAALGFRTVIVSTGSEAESLDKGFAVSSRSVGIGVTPSPVIFGDVPVTKSSTQTITVSSSGSNPLTIGSISIAGAFFALKGLPSLPLVLQPSATVSFNATFSPLGTISSTATITIVSDAASSPTVVQVSGHGTPPDQLPAAAITVVTDQPVYRRTQPIQISGAVTSSGGTGISSVPVVLQVSVNGTSRVLNPYTDALGNYRAVFQPTATDGGAFSVTATATAGGATQTATTSFRIFGLLVSPGSPMQDLVMGTSLSLPLNLQNIGDAALNNLTYSVTATPAGALTGTFNQTASALAPGGTVTVPLTLTAPSGNPPPAPVTVQINITAADSVSGASDPEASTVIITLRPAVSTLALTPASLSVGVNPGSSLARRFAVQNNGYISSNNSTVTLQDPTTFPWVSFGGADLGNLAPGTSNQFQVLINPPSNLALGDYTVLFNVSGGSNTLQGTINISVTRSTLGAVAFVISDDTGSKVGGATVTLYNTTAKKVFQGVTASDGTDTISGVDASDYNYVVAAPLHDPGTGKVTVTANTTTQVNLLLSYDVVTLSFSVIPTSIVDQYSVVLNITYTTKLPKPALKVVPPYLNFRFFPADAPGGTVPCSLSVTNTSSTAEVRKVTLDTSQLDGAQPSGQRIHVYFQDGSSLYQAGTLAPTASTTVACYAQLDGNDIPTHGAGSIIVQGNYDFSLDGNLQQGTTLTEVPVSYTRPNELSYDDLSFVYDLTDPANPVLTYGAGSFVHTVTSERPATVNLLSPSGPAFNGHNLAGFLETIGATNSVDVINANQTNSERLTNHILRVWWECSNVAP